MRKLIKAPASKLVRNSFRNPTGRNRLQPGILILPSRDAYGRILETWETRRTAERNHQDLTESYCRPSYLPPSLPGRPLTSGTAFRSSSPLTLSGSRFKLPINYSIRTPAGWQLFFGVFRFRYRCPPSDDAPPFQAIQGGGELPSGESHTTSQRFRQPTLTTVTRCFPLGNRCGDFSLLSPPDPLRAAFLVSNGFDAGASPRLHPSPGIP